MATDRAPSTPSKATSIGSGSSNTSGRVLSSVKPGSGRINGASSKLNAPNGFKR